MRRILLSLLLLSFSGGLFAQVKTTTKAKAPVKPVVKARNISITIPPLKNCKVYLGSYNGNYTKLLLMDSANLNDKSQGAFTGPTKLTGGIYFVVTPQMTRQFDILMDNKQQFSIVADTTQKEKVTITGSSDNDLFKTYSAYTDIKGRRREQLMQEFKERKTDADSIRIAQEVHQIDKDLNSFRDNISKNNPNSLLATLLNTMKRPETPAIPVVNGKADSSYPYRYVKDHFWDDVNFNDDRLVRTPFFEPKLDDYFKYLVSPEPDSIINELKYMLLSAKSGKEIYPFLLTKFTNKYIQPEIMGQDRVFVYLFENFYLRGDTTILNPASRKTIIERGYSLITNQLGQAAPALELTDTTGKKVSLYNIKAPFTVVTFWDPNCGHCKEEIPRYDSMYKAKWKDYGVAIYSVNIYENEVPSWKKFIAEKHISPEWTQAYETKEAKTATDKAGKANFRQLYDIYKTPTVYLLDKDKRIIAKQLSLEQFDDLIEAKRKTAVN